MAGVHIPIFVGNKVFNEFDHCGGDLRCAEVVVVFVEERMCRWQWCDSLSSLVSN